MRINVAGFEIDIWLVETVKQYQRVRTNLIKFTCDSGDVGKEWTQFHRYGNLDRRFDSDHCVDIALFDLLRGKRGISRDIVQIQLKCVRTRLLDLSGECDPTAQ